MGTAPIYDDRSLTADEAALVRWLLEHGEPAAAGFLPELAAARVVSRCPCGCASINLAIDGVTPPAGPTHVLADFEWQSRDGCLFGVFVFARDGLLAGLDVWSMDGRGAATALPAVEWLRPIGTGERPA